jgi:hypothetical protein
MINMQAISTHPLATAPALAVAATLAGQVRAGSELVKFPESYTAGVLYATVDRGNITEEIFTSCEAIDAVKNGQPIPRGTVITLVDYRDGELFQYVVMEKRTGQTCSETSSVFIIRPTAQRYGGLAKIPVTYMAG